jgi:hypothetical protein
MIKYQSEEDVKFKYQYWYQSEDVCQSEAGGRATKKSKKSGKGSSCVSSFEPAEADGAGATSAALRKSVGGVQRQEEGA